MSDNAPKEVPLESTEEKASARGSANARGSQPKQHHPGNRSQHFDRFLAHKDDPDTAKTRPRTVPRTGPWLPALSKSPILGPKIITRVVRSTDSELGENTSIDDFTHLWSIRIIVPRTHPFG